MAQIEMSLEPRTVLTDRECVIGEYKRPKILYNGNMTKQLELDVLALPAQDRLYLMRLLLDSFVVFDEGSDEIEVGRNDTEYLLSSPAMRERLLSARDNNEDLIPFEVVRERIGL